MVRLAAFALCAMACAEPVPRRGPPPLAGGPSNSSVVLAASKPLPMVPEERWVESVRAGDFQEASHRLGLLSPDRARVAEVRFVRARVALETGDPGAALRLLDRLEQELPLLVREIQVARADAQLSAGPFEDAARFFSARADADSLTKASLAF